MSLPNAAHREPLIDVNPAGRFVGTCGSAIAAEEFMNHAG
jgi:hypothetical protein